MHYHSIHCHEIFQCICYKHRMQFDALLCYCAGVDFLGWTHIDIYYLLCGHRIYMRNFSDSWRKRRTKGSDGVKLASSYSTWCHANSSCRWCDCSKEDEEKPSIYIDLLYKCRSSFHFNCRHTFHSQYWLLVYLWTLLDIMDSSYNSRTQYNLWASCQVYGIQILQGCSSPETFLFT